MRYIMCLQQNTMYTDFVLYQIVFLLQSLNKTTYQDHAEQTFLKKDFEEQIPRKPMMNMNTLEHAHLDR